MKKVILSVAAMMAFTAVSFAQNGATAVAVEATPVATTPDDKGDDKDKKKIEVSALPDAVKATLASEQYKAWEVEEAWHVSGKDEHYVLKMKKGDEKTKLKINKEGQII